MVNVLGEQKYWLLGLVLTGATEANGQLAHAQLVSVQEAPHKSEPSSAGPMVVMGMSVLSPMSNPTPASKSKNPTMQASSTLATSVAGSIPTPLVKELSAIFIQNKFTKKTLVLSQGFSSVQIEADFLLR